MTRHKFMLVSAV